MSDELQLGRAPRSRRPVSRRSRTVVVAGVVVVAAGVGVVTVRPWERAAVPLLSATGAVCTVDYGDDLVVVVAEVRNSTRAAATVARVGLDTGSPDLRAVGGAIDIVAGTGCDHVLVVDGDSVTSGTTGWVGVTAQRVSCHGSPATLAVSLHPPGRPSRITVSVPAAPDGQGGASSCARSGPAG